MLKLVTILTNLLSKRLLKLARDLGEPSTSIQFIQGVSKAFKDQATLK